MVPSQLAVAHSFDLILMGIQMPKMGGREATRRIRSDLHLTDLPVIALTANATAQDRQRCLEAGTNDVLLKPIEVKVMTEELMRWIRVK